MKFQLLTTLSVLFLSVLPSLPALARSDIAEFKVETHPVSGLFTSAAGLPCDLKVASTLAAWAGFNDGTDLEQVRPHAYFKFLRLKVGVSLLGERCHGNGMSEVFVAADLGLSEHSPPVSFSPDDTDFVEKIRSQLALLPLGSLGTVSAPRSDIAEILFKRCTAMDMEIIDSQTIVLKNSCNGKSFLFEKRTTE